MIYTIGNKETYAALFEGGIPQKKGREGGYPGGSVWETRAEAEAYLREHGMTEHTVWGVEADWERDTESSKHGGFHDLLRDADLVDLRS